MTFSSLLILFQCPWAFSFTARNSGVLRTAILLTGAGVPSDGFTVHKRGVELKNLLAMNAIFLSPTAHAQKVMKKKNKQLELRKMKCLLLWNSYLYKSNSYK